MAKTAQAQKFFGYIGFSFSASVENIEVVFSGRVLSARDS
jgi:hypothetical protein